MMISLKSADGEIFELEEAVAVQSNIIKLMIEEDCTSSGVRGGGFISLPNVKSDILIILIKFWNRHAAFARKAAPTVSEVKDIEKFDAKFFKKMKWDTILEVAMAAQYLDSKKLLDLNLQAMADRIEKKSPEQIRKLFHIENDFTPEEEAEMNEEDAWRQQEEEEAPEQIPEEKKEFTIEDAAEALKMLSANPGDN